MNLTDRVVADTLSIVPTIAYFAVAPRGDELRVLFVRPFGAHGQGLWLRRVLPEGPALSPAWEAGT